MSQQFLRWYDQIPELEKVMIFLEQLPIEKQAIIAQDLLQIIMTEVDVDVEESLNYIDKAKNTPQNRWYDAEPNLANSLEVIKSLPFKKQQLILNKLVESVYQLYVEELTSFDS